MNFPNAINSPTAANLSRATIIELAVYVYQTALNFTDNVQFAEQVLQDFVTRAEKAAKNAENVVKNAATIAAQTIRDIVAADADRAATAAQTAGVDAASATSAATRAETAAQSAETSEGVCNSYAGGAAISAENAAQSAANASDSATVAQSAANNAASEFNAQIDAKIAEAVSQVPIVPTLEEVTGALSAADYKMAFDGTSGLYMLLYRRSTATAVPEVVIFTCENDGTFGHIAGATFRVSWYSTTRDGIQLKDGSSKENLTYSKLYRIARLV